MQDREPPIKIPAQSPPSKPEDGAAIIFMHGLGDDAQGWEGVGKQFQNANKLPHMQWIFPNAKENRDAMQTAWYTPSPLPPFPSSRPELDDPEDEDGLKDSMQYVVSLIDDLVSEGIPPNRIVVAGFSQGCAMTLLTGLTSKYNGKLGGLLGLAGYMPLADKISELRREASLPDDVGETPIFFQRGGRDMLVPKRYYRICHEKLKALGVKDENLELHEYENLGHSVSAQVLQDMCTWLEKAVPSIETE